jgi:hypothetical protein
LKEWRFKLSSTVFFFYFFKCMWVLVHLHLKSQKKKRRSWSSKGRKLLKCRVGHRGVIFFCSASQDSYGVEGARFGVEVAASDF